MLAEEQQQSSFAAIQQVVREYLKPHVPVLGGFRNSQELHASALYQRLEPWIRQVLETPQSGSFMDGESPPRESYRVAAWNIERGKQLDGQVEVLQHHEYFREADVLLLTETDVGMARSGNHDVAREIAERLRMHYAFIPCYWSLVKGSGLERDVDGDNDLGLHGNAILSRYPLSNLRPVHLENGIDIFAAKERRLGCQTALLADIALPQRTVTFACIHLDAHSTQRHRRDQMAAVLDGLARGGGPVVLGGDWNTTTYNSSNAFMSICGFCLRVLMGVGRVIRNHYLHPYNWFERELFALLEERGFEYRRSNVLGEYTICYDITDRQTYTALREWVPQFCFPFIHWSLRDFGGKCPLKIDWFATRGVEPVDARVIHDVREGRAVPLSDHDAIGFNLKLT
jgi:endonuclease/exonuclease/phosphatase family metal-dependent hydrolase